MIHKINDKFAIILEKTTFINPNGRAVTVRACISHPDASKVKASSVAYLKTLKVLVSKKIVSNIKVDQDFSFCMQITFDVSDVWELDDTEARDALRNLIPILS